MVSVNSSMDIVQLEHFAAVCGIAGVLGGKMSLVVGAVVVLLLHIVLQYSPAFDLKRVMTYFDVHSQFSQFESAFVFLKHLC